MTNLCMDVTNVYIDAANLSLKMKKQAKTIQESLEKRQMFQALNYYKLKAQFNNLAKLFWVSSNLSALCFVHLYLLSGGLRFNNSPEIHTFGGRFFHMKKNLKKLLKKEYIEQKQKIMDKIEEMESRNPTMFWKLVNQMKEYKQTGSDINIQFYWYLELVCS